MFKFKFSFRFLRKFALAMTITSLSISSVAYAVNVGGADSVGMTSLVAAENQANEKSYSIKAVNPVVDVTTMSLLANTLRYPLNDEDIQSSIRSYLQKKAEEEAARKAEEARKKAEEEAKKKAAEEAARKVAEEAAEAKRQAEEAARKKAEEASKGRCIGDFKLTFYTPDPSENGGYGVTATGKSLSANVWKAIAVDPSVIPLGSTVYIEGLGTFTAEDTGGAIQGNRIDVLVNYGEANSMGVRYAKVYVK